MPPTNATRTLDDAGAAARGDAGLEQLVAEARAATNDAGALGRVWEREFGVPATPIP